MNDKDEDYQHLPTLSPFSDEFAFELREAVATPVQLVLVVLVLRENLCQVVAELRFCAKLLNANVLNCTI